MLNLILVTGSSNSLGEKFLESISKTKDALIVGLSRKGCNIPGINNIQVDLLDLEKVKLELQKALGSNVISTVKIIHTASKIKNEFNDIQNQKFNTIDNDGDGIDDEVLECTYMTLKNTHEAVLSCLSDKKIPISIGIIGTLLDKKNREPSSHKSMIRANKILRKWVENLCNSYSNYQGICTSVGTIATRSELQYRKFGEHEYWLKEEDVVNFVLKRLQSFVPGYDDQDLFTFNPRYESYYKNETDEKMTQRIMKEIGL